MAKPPKFFYHNDGSFLLYCAPPMTPEEFVYESVGRFMGTQVDAVVCHQFGFGDAVPLWPTEVPGAKGIDMETVGYVSEWRQQEIMLRLWAEGIDPWQLALEATHEAGMEYWIANRFNDLHGSRYQWKSEWRVSHPEYELGDKAASPMPRSDRQSTGLNFAIPEVRAHRLALVEEACTRYDTDGFEWDFTRHPGYHFPDMEEGRPKLTEYMREARALLNRVGEARGRPVGFGVRVAGTPEKCHELGLELETWIKEGLVDFVSPSCYWDTVTYLPFESFLEMAKGTDCRILGCTSEQVGPGGHSRPPKAALRAGALNAWKQGVDGIYLFNFHHQTIAKMDDREVLSQLGDPATLEFRDKLYAEAPARGAVSSWPSAPFYEGSDHQLPLTLEENSVETIRFLVSDDLETAGRRGILDAVTLELILVSVTSEDAFEFKLNGKALPQTVPLDVPQNYTVGPGPSAFQGNYALRYDVRAGDWVKQGWNEVEAVLRKRNPRVRTELVLHDLNLEINYRILPMRG